MIPWPVVFIAGGVAFVLGFFVGQQVFSLVLRNQWRRIAFHRRMLGEIRRYMERQGISVPTWIADYLDRDHDDQH